MANSKRAELLPSPFPPKSPNNATVFFRWVLSNSEYFPLQEEPENVFIPYPDDCELQNFDPPDRKYIALSYAHPDKPAIVEATDSKWWGIKQNLDRHGIIVYFIDEEYIESKFQKKWNSFPPNRNWH